MRGWGKRGEFGGRFGRALERWRLAWRCGFCCLVGGARFGSRTTLMIGYEIPPARAGAYDGFRPSSAVRRQRTGIALDAPFGSWATIYGHLGRRQRLRSSSLHPLCRMDVEFRPVPRICSICQDSLGNICIVVRRRTVIQRHERERGRDGGFRGE